MRNKINNINNNKDKQQCLNNGIIKCVKNYKKSNLKLLNRKQSNLKVDEIIKYLKERSLAIKVGLKNAYKVPSVNELLIKIYNKPNKNKVNSKDDELVK